MVAEKRVDAGATSSPSRSPTAPDSSIRPRGIGMLFLRGGVAPRAGGGPGQGSHRQGVEPAAPRRGTRCEQQIQRYEVTGYASASLARLCDIVAALGVDVHEVVSLPSTDAAYERG